MLVHSIQIHRISSNIEHFGDMLIMTTGILIKYSGLYTQWSCHGVQGYYYEGIKDY